MRNTFVLFFLAALTLPLLSEADMGIPSVQAICRVTLKTGQVIEGGYIRWKRWISGSSGYEWFSICDRSTHNPYVTPNACVIWLEF